MRHISPLTFTDEFFGRITVEYRLLWMGLICLADDQGRMLDNPTLIAGSIFPYDSHIRDDIIESGLALFVRNKKIMRYTASGNGSGRRLIQIIKWWKYQASAHWAARSQFPAPDHWFDRVRTHQGTQIVTLNWDKQGGLRSLGGTKGKMPTNAGPTQGQRRANAAPAKAQEEVEVEVEADIENEKRIPPSNLPPKKGARQADGRKDVAQRIQTILHVASFRDTRKAILLSGQVATRILSCDPIDYVIASFAGAFSSSKANDPIAVAVHQLQENTVSPAFYDPKTWRSVPREILRAAGIDDIDAHIRNSKMAKFLDR